MYMQYHHTGKSLLLHCCPKVGLDSPQGTKRPLRGSICCQHYQDQLEETSNLEKWSGQSWTSQTACYGPVTLKVMHACNYIISSQIHLPKSLETTCWTHLQGIRGVCTAVRMFSMAAVPQIISTAVRTLSHVRGWLPVPGDPSSHLTNMTLG